MSKIRDNIYQTKLKQDLFKNNNWQLTEEKHTDIMQDNSGT